MKTRAEMLQWIEEAAATLGDPAIAVGQAFFRWDPKWRDGGEDLACHEEGGGIALVLGGTAIAVRVQLGEPKITPNGLEAFGATPIAPGVWSLSPSLNLPGIVHVFVVLYGVPDPAPWERRIVIARIGEAA